MAYCTVCWKMNVCIYAIINSSSVEIQPTVLLHIYSFITAYVLFAVVHVDSCTITTRSEDRFIYRLATRHFLAKKKKKINLVKEKLLPQNQQYLKSEREKKSSISPSKSIGTAETDHLINENKNQKPDVAKVFTYHKCCHQFLCKHNPHLPMMFPRSSVQSSMGCPLQRQHAF